MSCALWTVPLLWPMPPLWPVPRLALWHMPRLALIVLLALQPGCALWRGGYAPEPAAPDLSQGVAVVESESLDKIFQRTSTFYKRLAGRRFNTLASYRDDGLRSFFRTDRAHADFFADFTGALRRANFERNRPLRLEVIEFRLEAPGRAIVSTRIIGENDLPLRWWRSELLREDRWERTEGTWWLAPGRI